MIIDYVNNKTAHLSGKILLLIKHVIYVIKEKSFVSTHVQ